MTRWNEYTNTALSGIPSDYLPVTASDTVDNCGELCIGLVATVASTVAVYTHGGGETARVFGLAAGTPLPGKFRRVLSSGTTLGSSAILYALQG